MTYNVIQEPPVSKQVPKPANQRVQSIDVLRGLIMLIMALDHVRDFFHAEAFLDSPTNLATTTPFLFFTRWITHFCAPVFLFLSGVSAYISGRRKNRKELSLFLITRGLWLVFVEIVIITFSISFNPFYDSIFLQVIWAIGWSMVILGLLVRTSLAVIVATGFMIVFGHNMLDYVQLPADGTASILWNIFLTSPMTAYPLGERTIVLIYAILPWTGIMLLGYGLGYFYSHRFDPRKRTDMLLLAGLGVTALFIVLRFMNAYGDPAPWSYQKEGMYTVLSFLNVTKYPASLQYACMTLGPALIFLAFTEGVQNRVASVLTVYGRSPFFYYVIHFMLIHLICVIFFFLSGYGWNDVVSPDKSFLLYFRPRQFGFDLWVVYAVWLFVIVVLYWPCKWFGRYKSTHKKWWLSYV